MVTYLTNIIKISNRLVASTAATWNAFSSEKMVTQVQKAKKYIVVKMMNISDGSVQRALREFGPNPPTECSIDVCHSHYADSGRCWTPCVQRWGTIHGSLNLSVGLHVCNWRAKKFQNCNTLNQAIALSMLYFVLKLWIMFISEIISYPILRQLSVIYFQREHNSCNIMHSLVIYHMFRPFLAIIR
jgi:hypothetical protein